MDKKRILVTGAAGFIGFHFSRKRREKGDVVVGLDNFNDYYNPALKRARAKILQDEGVVTHEMDLADQSGITRLVDELKPTHVVHLAAQAGCRYSITHPEVYLKSNVEGFLHILEVCRKRPDIRLVYASSSSVYGSNKKIPFSLKDSTDHPTNVYGATKKMNELMANTYHHLYHLPLVGLRFFTAYGPWGRPDMAYFSFTKALFENKPIDLYNFGNMRRDFTYIDDIVSGIEHSLQIEEGCHFFNLGNHRPESLHTLVELIEHETGKKAQKNLLEMPPSEIVETYADIDESRERLGFEPKVTLAEGIHQFVKWYRAYFRV